jgi:hypothetical protein
MYIAICFKEVIIICCSIDTKKVYDSNIEDGYGEPYGRLRKFKFLFVEIFLTFA